MSWPSKSAVGARPSGRQNCIVRSDLSLVVKLRQPDNPEMTDQMKLMRPGSSALRRGRFSAVNNVYHVTSCTKNRRPSFERFAIARAVVNAIRREDSGGYTQTLAFVVMPDHIHWLVRIAGNRNLSTSVNNVKSWSARQVNAKVRRSGPIWQKGFHDHGIRAEEDLTTAARYIVANPLRSGLVERLGDYPHWDAIWLNEDRPLGRAPTVKV